MKTVTNQKLFTAHIEFYADKNLSPDEAYDELRCLPLDNSVNISIVHGKAFEGCEFGYSGETGTYSFIHKKGRR